MSWLSALLAFRPLAIAVRLFLAAVFLAAAAGKIALPGQFAHDIYAYQMLDPSVVNLMAIYLPWLELLSATALLLGLAKRGAAFVIASQLAMFLFAIAFNLARGRNFDCGCFGKIAAPDLPVIRGLFDFFLLSSDLMVTLWRDLVLFAMALFVLHSPVVWRGVRRATRGQ